MVDASKSSQERQAIDHKTTHLALSAIWTGMQYPPSPLHHSSGERQCYDAARAICVLLSCACALSNFT
eukprot:6484006-Amphidinium_carterae.1